MEHRSKPGDPRIILAISEHSNHIHSSLTASLPTILYCKVNGSQRDKGYIYGGIERNFIFITARRSWVDSDYNPL